MLKTWKKGTVRAVLAANKHGADGPWDQQPVEPIAAGTNQIVLQAEVAGRPGLYDFRARVTKGEDRSSWEPSVRLGNLIVC